MTEKSGDDGPYNGDRADACSTKCICLDVVMVTLTKEKCVTKETTTVMRAIIAEMIVLSPTVVMVLLIVTTVKSVTERS